MDWMNDQTPEECDICIFCFDHTCGDCSKKEFYKRVLIPNPEEVVLAQVTNKAC